MQRLKNGIGLNVYADMRLFKYADDPRPWPDVDKDKLIPVRTGGINNEPVIAENRDGVVTEFASALEAGSAVGLRPASIYYACKRNSGFGKNGYKFKFSKR